MKTNTNILTAAELYAENPLIVPDNDKLLVPSNRIFVNTEYFSEAAKDFKRNGGSYCRAPNITREFHDYWDEQTKRCFEGFSTGGVWIPGRLYFYLNFGRINRVSDADLKRIRQERKKYGKVRTKIAYKETDFPKFWEIAYEWFQLKQVAWLGGSFRTSHQLVLSPGGKHLTCVKSRGAGFSYMEAIDGLYNYTFIPGSKSYYFAANQAYLDTDGILNKVQPTRDHINDHCPYWRQNRQVKYSTMHQRASFIDDHQQERGSMSELIGVVVDKPSKTRGKRGRKLVFEEFGSFPKGKQALAIALGTIRDGSTYVGQATCFGTGGEEGPEIEALSDIFSQPDIYDMLEFFNVWDEDAQNTYCGYFVPYWKADMAFMDKDGNVDIPAAQREHAIQETKLTKAADYKELDRFQAEYPSNPAQALHRISGNPFNTTLCNRRIKQLETDDGLKMMLRYGHMIKPDTVPDFMILPKNEARPVEDYPHNQKEDLTGCVTVYQRPFLINGKPPDGMYKLILDPYAQEEAEDKTSLFAGGIFKMDNPYDQIDVNIEHAWYAGRPESIYTAYEQLLWLALWYNARIQCEIAGGGQAFLNYARDRGLLHLLLGEPETMQSSEATSFRTSYFTNMTTDRKRLGLTYLVDWHKRIRGLDATGRMITTVDRSMNIGALREMANFNAKKNADRISYHITAMFEMKDTLNDLTDDETTTGGGDDYWNREFFSEGEMTDEYITPLG